jgi:hypothetical protein
LLVLAPANLLGAFSSLDVPQQTVNAVQYLLVAVVIITAVILQRTGEAIRTSLIQQGKADVQESVQPRLYAPQGAEYEAAAKKSKLASLSALVIIGSSFFLLPFVGNMVMSSGAPFEVFNLVIAGFALVLLTAFIASKYFAVQARKAGARSIEDQERGAQNGSD